MSVDDARRVIEDAIEARVFPAASVEVGAADRLLWSEAFGHLTFAADAPAASHDTIFDLASLTKPIATTTIVMELVRTGALTLEARVADSSTNGAATDRERGDRARSAGARVRSSRPAGRCAAADPA